LDAMADFIRAEDAVLIGDGKADMGERPPRRQGVRVGRISQGGRQAIDYFEDGNP